MTLVILSTQFSIIIFKEWNTIDSSTKAGNIDQHLLCPTYCASPTSATPKSFKNLNSIKTYSHLVYTNVSYRKHDVFYANRLLKNVCQVINNLKGILLSHTTYTLNYDPVLKFLTLNVSNKCLSNIIGFLIGNWWDFRI